MNGNELSQLIDQRWSHLHELLDISRQQMTAIQAGRMSDLMRLLSDKQAPLNRLANVAGKIRNAVGEDPDSRHWESQQQRSRCRSQQEECERMHLELLAIEAECESELEKSRNTIAQKLDRVDSGQRAASSYAGSSAESTAGAQLDLSSD